MAHTARAGNLLPGIAAQHAAAAPSAAYWRRLSSGPQVKEIAGVKFKVGAKPAPGQPFHLAFPVHDLDAARAFWGGTLGCTEGRCAPGEQPPEKATTARGKKAMGIAAECAWRMKASNKPSVNHPITECAVPPCMRTGKWIDFSLYGHQIVCHWVGGDYKAPEFYSPVGGDEVCLRGCSTNLCACSRALLVRFAGPRFSIWR